MKTKKTRKGVFFMLLSALLVFGVLLTGCSTGEEPEPGPGPGPGPTTTVIINKNPASKSYTLEEWQMAAEADKTLTVGLSETGEFSYQWYTRTDPSSQGTIIESATEASFLPSISSNGKYYYYVEVKADTATLTSGNACIRIIDPDNFDVAPTSFSIGSDRLNYVRGVGGTGAFMFRIGGQADASPDVDVKYIDLLMGQLGCNILRIMVQDDYETYVTDAIQSRNKDQFYHNARRNFFAVIRKVNEYNGYVFANPWTAPGYMKTGGGEGGLAGGILTTNGTNYVDYANHLRDFLKWLNTNNAPIFALGILNEPDFGQGANYEGMGMTASVTKDFFRTVGNFTTERVNNRSGAGPGSGTVSASDLVPDIIPGYGGGSATHNVLVMSGDSMGDIASYMNLQLSDSLANDKIELMGRHYYANANRYTRVVGNANTKWFDRDQLDFDAPHADAALAQSPQMYAPGSTATNIKREVWQTEHDHNSGASTTPPASNAQKYWNYAFAALHDVDWALRVVGESVFDWWYSASYSGLVTSYQLAGFEPYTITPRGRAFAHYARYVNETWTLPIDRTRGTINFNVTGSSASPGYDCGATDPKISAYEDVNGKFISIVMYTPTLSARGANGGVIANGISNGGTYGNDDPTRGSTNVGRIEVVLPDGFTATGASALRTYGNDNADGKDYDTVPNGTPRYWIDEPVFLYTTADGKAAVEVTLPGGNVISIMVKGTWPGRDVASPERKRPYTVN
jgi:O-glycosyl hydrolase